MARRRLSREEEAAMIADAEAARDDPDSQLVPVHVRAMPASVVVSVRIPFTDARRLRDIAATEQMTLSEVLLDAVKSRLRQPAQQASVSHGGQVLFLAGVEPTTSCSEGDSPVRISVRQDKAG